MRPVMAIPKRQRQALRPCSGWILATATAIATAAPTAAWADGSCQLGGREYPENASVCSNGLVLYCSNRVWQNNDGTHCNDPSGAYLSPLRPYTPRSDEPIPEYWKEKYPNLNLE